MWGASGLWGDFSSIPSVTARDNRKGKEKVWSPWHLREDGHLSLGVEGSGKSPYLQSQWATSGLGLGLKGLWTWKWFSFLLQPHLWRNFA